MDTKLSLRKLALFAYHEETRLATEQREREKREELERDAQNAAERFKVLLDVDVHLEPGQRFVEIDGITFAWSRGGDYGYRYSLHVVRPCEKCGEPIYSYPVDSLYDVGRQLEDFSSHSLHEHREEYHRPEPAAPKPPDDLAQLRDLLRRILGLEDEE